MINSELRSINWSNRVDELDVDQAVDYFTNCFMSVITQHIPNREITCCDRDAPWITDLVLEFSTATFKMVRAGIKNIMDSLKQNSMITVDHKQKTDKKSNIIDEFYRVNQREKSETTRQ